MSLCINVMFQGTKEGVQFCVWFLESHNVEKVLCHKWRDQRESNLPCPVLLLLSDRQTLAFVPHNVALPGPDTSLQYIRTQYVNWYVPSTLRFLGCL
jgi:hypothetical protein